MSQPGALGVVLAGGRSRRFGGPKALFPVGGRAMAEWALLALKPHTSMQVVVTHDPQVASALGISGRPDRIPGLGPLGGSILLSSGPVNWASSGYSSWPVTFLWFRRTWWPGSWGTGPRAHRRRFRSVRGLWASSPSAPGTPLKACLPRRRWPSLADRSMEGCWRRWERSRCV